MHFSVKYAIYSVKCTLFSMWCTMFSTQCTVYSEHFSENYISHCTLISVKRSIVHTASLSVGTKAVA